MSNQLAAARQRVLAYINRRKIAKGLDIERVHCFDNEFDLLLSDLEALAAHEAAKPDEPTAFMGVNPRTGTLEFCAHQPSPSVMRDFDMKPLYAAPAPEAAKPEPVAFVPADDLAPFLTYGGSFLANDHPRDDSDVPLYAAPVAVASPLSDEQIEAMPVWKHFVGLMPEHRLEFTRAIEAAHGIKEMKP